MIRAELRNNLDSLVGQSRLTLVCGLPRVGRTKLIREWAIEKDDTLIKNFAAGEEEAASIVIYDHFESINVDEFVKSFRAAQQRNSKTRYVIVPHDLKCAYLLNTKLTGNLRLIEVSPLQLSDIIAGKSELFETTTVPTTNVAQAQPTNHAELNENTSWLRGGFPDSYEAVNDHTSIAWRNTMLGGLLSRDYSDLGDFPVSNLPDILKWAANQNGGELDEEGCPIGNKRDVRSALHVLEQLGLTRKLPNYPSGNNLNFGKKVKLYVRDSGILHALRGIETFPQLQLHNRKGDSWESHSIEAMILATKGIADCYFYRIKNKEGTFEEIDLIIDLRKRNQKLIAIECKVSPNTSP